MLKPLELGLVVDRISQWIKQQVQDAGATGTVFGLSGGADSALVALLCKRAYPHSSLGVLMPCHSSKVSLERANELAKKIKLDTITIDLSKAHEAITSQTNKSLVVEPKNKMALAALRSCLRAPTLDYVAKLNNALIVGTGNRDEDELARYYQKRGDGAVDISPIAKLHKSEVYQLLQYLNCPKSIIEAVPTADLWGPDSGQADEQELGISYQEMEWAISENDKTNVLGLGGDGYMEDPLATFSSYTERQLKVLKQLKEMENNSRHKAMQPPVFNIRVHYPELFVGYVEPKYNF
jgi:NAD+ synthase